MTLHQALVNLKNGEKALYVGICSNLDLSHTIQRTLHSH